MRILTPQLATDAYEEEATALLTSPDWLCEEKVDGKRVMIVSNSTGALTLIGRNGQITSFPAGFTPPAIPPDSQLDTEFLWIGRLVGLDLLAWKGEPLATVPALDRYQYMLEQTPVLGPAFQPVACAWTLEGKARLVKRLREQQAEGIILKLAGAPYSAGRPTIGGPLRRLKWRKRLDAVVMRRIGDDRRSFEMFCFNAMAPQYIGAVSAHTFYDKLQPGESRVAEVSYLMASDSLRLIQPTIVRLRTDKAPQECTISQIQIGKRYIRSA